LLNRQGIEGGEDGTRTFALAARRAYTGDYSVVVVLWSLIDNDELFVQKIWLRHDWRSLIIFKRLRPGFFSKIPV
jgi:hypothetical protein